jgi:hypothetical protein
LNAQYKQQGKLKLIWCHHFQEVFLKSISVIKQIVISGTATSNNAAVSENPVPPWSGVTTK